MKRIADVEEKTSLLQDSKCLGNEGKTDANIDDESLSSGGMKRPSATELRLPHRRVSARGHGELNQFQRYVFVLMSFL